jgi:hypothetical protein
MWGRLFAVFHRGAPAATLEHELGVNFESQYRNKTNFYVDLVSYLFSHKRLVWQQTGKRRRDGGARVALELGEREESCETAYPRQITTPNDLLYH